MRSIHVACILHHAATHCNTLQHTATCCNTLKSTAAHYNKLQHIALAVAKKKKSHEAFIFGGNDTKFRRVAVLQFVAVCCSVLQCVAVCCNMHPIWIHDADVDPLITLLVCKSALCVRSMNLLRNMVSRRGGGLGSSTIFKKFNEPYAPL